jgi:hypothetical protein
VRDVNEPRWVRVITLVSTLVIASFGAVGLLLADLGAYKPFLVLILGLALFIFLYRHSRRVLTIDGEVTTTQRVCASIAVGLSGVTAIWNASNASQHAQINRDGGIYLNAGKWIATHGTLDLQPFAGPFAGPYIGHPLAAASAGMKQHGSHLEFEISHMLPAIFAEAKNIGGNNLMFLTVPILSGFALLAFYLLATRLLAHPVAALGATATLAFLMPQVSFSRDSTTEIPIQVLLFTALWLLCDRRTLRAPGPAFVAGLLLGLVQAMHVDGLAFLVGLPAVFAVTWLNTRQPRRQQVRRGILWATVGVGAGAVLGAFDLYRWDRYYLSVVGKNIAQLVVVVAVAIVAAAVAVLLLRRPQVFATFKRIRPRVAYGAGVLGLVGGFGAWFVRPLIQHTHAGFNPTVAFVQKLNHLPIDGTKRYAENSVRWISWYVGPITLTIAIIGAAVLAVALVRGTLRLPTQLATFMFAPPALLYIWKPSITPDHVWAARRFLPAVFPALILVTFAVLCTFALAPGYKFSGQRRSAAVVLAVATVVFPVLTIRNVSQMTEQRGLFPVITKACKILGPDGAVVILKENGSVVYLSDPQTFRSFCNVPVTIMNGPPNAGLLHKLAARWKSAGRRLYVVAALPQTIRRVFPNADLQLTGGRTNPHFLEQTLTRRPTTYAPESYHLTLSVVVPIAATFVTPTPIGPGATTSTTAALPAPAG